MNTFIPSKEILEITITKAVEEAVSKRLPEIIKKATQKEYYTIKEVCEIFDITRRHLQYLRSSGQISYSKNGRKVYFRAKDLSDFFDKNYIESEID